MKQTLLVINNWMRNNIDLLHIKIKPWRIIVTILEIKIDNEFKPHSRVFYLFDLRILNRIFCLSILGFTIDLDFGKQEWTISFECLGVYFWSSDRKLQKEIIVLRNLK